MEEKKYTVMRNDDIEKPFMECGICLGEPIAL
jgi:hypothetical protein